MKSTLIALSLVSVFLPASVNAQTANAPRTVKSATGQLGASVNTAGLQQSFDLGASRTITTSTNSWLADAHIAAGGSVAATPAGLRGGAWAEFAPLSVIAIRAGADAGQYFGTFQSLTSFDTRLDAFDPDARKARGGAHPGRTVKLFVAETVQLRAGHFAARSTLTLERWSSSAAGPFFYEPTRDTLLAVGGDNLASGSTAILYIRPLAGGGQFMCGPTHSMTRVRGNQLNQVQKLGVVAVRQMSGNHFGLVRPNVSAQAFRYLDDPSKQGQWGAAMAVGFSIGKR